MVSEQENGGSKDVRAVASAARPTKSTLYQPAIAFQFFKAYGKTESVAKGKIIRDEVKELRANKKVTSINFFAVQKDDKGNPVKDASGNTLGDVSISVAVTAGGGTLTGAPTNTRGSGST